MARSTVSDGQDFEAMMRNYERRIELLERRLAATTTEPVAQLVPSAWARISSTSQVISNTTSTQVTLATIDWNYGALYNPAFTNQLTAVIPGFYSCAFRCRYSDTTGTFLAAAWMETNRDATRYGELNVSAHNPGAGQHAAETIWLGAGDSVRLWTYHNRGATYDIVSARLTAALIYPAQTVEG